MIVALLNAEPPTLLQLLSRRNHRFPQQQAARTTAALPNQERLIRSLNQMAAIGLQPDGSVCRRGFTQADVLGRNQLTTWMRDLGLQVRVDAAGNLIGRLEGSEPSLPALVTGSHLDTVPTGGRFDGVLGVLAGLEAVHALVDEGIRLRHPLELVAFADEESTMVGCKGMAGSASPDPSAFTTSNGEPIQKNLECIGGNWSELAAACRPDSAIAAFLELHVEQGAVLEQRAHAIGVVEGVVGQRRFTIHVSGQANHAGTTPMNMRQDALTAASRIVLAIEEMAQCHSGDPVATVGRLEVWPNAANVVPGAVTLTVDLRDLDPNVLDQLQETLTRTLERIAVLTDCQIRLEPQFEVAPTPSAALLMTEIEAAASSFGLSSSRLPSRASHDAQEMGRRWPMGMIFVPSRGGFSHSAAEFTTDEQCWAGTAVLLETLQRLDRALP